jgi:hypothetical protein
MELNHPKDKKQIWVLWRLCFYIFPKITTKYFSFNIFLQYELTFLPLVDAVLYSLTLNMIGLWHWPKWVHVIPNARSQMVIQLLTGSFPAPVLQTLSPKNLSSPMKSTCLSAPAISTTESPPSWLDTRKMNK